MSDIPDSMSWSPLYLANLPERTWGNPDGDCTSASTCYALEMRAIIQGDQPTQLAELDLYYQQRLAGGTVGTVLTGGDIYAACELAQSAGVSRESLWPTTLIREVGGVAAMNTAPNAAAVADRTNHRLLEFGLVSGTADECIAQCKALIAGGCPLIVAASMDHNICAWGYGPNGIVGFDNRATVFFGEFSVAWDVVVTNLILVVKNVAFPVLSGVPPAPPTPVVSGFLITQAQLDTLCAIWSSVTMPTITQAQIDQVQAILTAVSGASATPPTAPPTTTPPPSASGINVAAAASGGIALASGTTDGYSAMALNNGERIRNTWVGPYGVFPSWGQVNFLGQKSINRAVVYTVQDSPNPIEPADTMTFASYGVVSFDVQTWNGTAWDTQASVANNNLVKRTVTFPTVTTDKLRVMVTSARSASAQLTEIEVWTA